MLTNTKMSTATRLIAIETLQTTDNEAVKALCAMWLARFKDVRNERTFYAIPTQD